jgi:hypothetical protein
LRGPRKSISNLHHRDIDDKLNSSTLSIKSARNMRSDKIEPPKQREFLKKGSHSKSSILLTQAKSSRNLKDSEKLLKKDIK